MEKSAGHVWDTHLPEISAGECPGYPFPVLSAEACLGRSNLANECPDIFGVLISRESVSWRCHGHSFLGNQYSGDVPGTHFPETRRSLFRSHGRRVSCVHGGVNRIRQKVRKSPTEHYCPMRGMLKKVIREQYRASFAPRI